MKTELSSLDVKYLVEELQFLVGGRIQKFFQNGKELQVVLHVPTKGTQQLIAGPGKLYLTKYALEHPEQPTGFAMYLRKHLSGKRIQKIEQVGFERIVILHFPEHKLYLELFGGGNCIVTTENNRIWSVMEKQFWKDRQIKQMELYELPPTKLDPLTLSSEIFAKKLKESDKKIVVFLASELSLGGVYAEELLLRAKLDKNRKASDLTAKESTHLLKELGNMLQEKASPSLVLENGQMSDVVPIDLESYKACLKKPFERFYEAVDEFFTQGQQKVERKEAAEEKQPTSKNLSKLEKRKEHQLKALEELKKEEENGRRKADLIYLHYQELEELLKKVRENPAFNKIPDVTIDAKAKKMTVQLEQELELIYTKNLQENAGLYYDAAKKVKQKIEGAEEALKETLKLIEQQTASNAEEEKSVAKRKKRAKKEWFEKFKWFFTSQGKLVIAGRDATTNEIIIKKHTDKDDLVFHTDMAGSPFAILKIDKENATEEEKEEVATFCASQSRAWSLGYGAAETYLVKSDQVSKEANAGEFLTKGAFVVRGERHYFKPEMKLAVGIMNDGKVMCGPVLSVEANCGKNYVVLVPGETKKSDTAKSIKKFLEKYSEYDVSLDDVMQVMPPGDCRIAKK